jgi:hypothetical protein
VLLLSLRQAAPLLQDPDKVGESTLKLVVDFKKKLFKGLLILDDFLVFPLYCVEFNGFCSFQAPVFALFGV